MPKPPPIDPREVNALQKQLEDLKAKFSTGEVGKTPEGAKQFLEQIGQLATRIANAGDSVLKDDANKRKELADSAAAIQNLVKHMPGMKG